MVERHMSIKRRRRLEWDQVLPIDFVLDYPELVLRTREAEKVLPPQFVILWLDVMGTRVEITVQQLLDQWTTKDQA